MRPFFIHIPKTAGTSIAQVANVESINKNHIDKKYNSQYTQYGNICHALWKHLKREYQVIPAIAVVRNPWSRTVSRYTYTLMKVKIRETSIFSITKECTFEQFLETRFNDILESWQTIMGWQNQLDYITDINRKVQCDILRFENIEHELSAYMERKIQLPYRRRSNAKDYRKFYTDITQQIVADWYKDDIDYFGFNFDTSATKNTYYPRGE